LAGPFVELTLVLPQYATIRTNLLVPLQTTSTGTASQHPTFTIKQELARWQTDRVY